MKICLIGDIKGNLDEGMKNIAYSLYSELSKSNDVIVIHPRDVFNIKTLLEIKNFNPEIVHYIPGPSVKSFFIMRLVSIFAKNAKFIMSSPMPQISRVLLRFSRLIFNPDVFLAHSSKIKDLLLEAGFRVKMTPISGVDRNRFTPIKNRKLEKSLRKKYKLPDEMFIVLHVGHIKRKRNLKLFSKIARKYKDVKVVVVGSTTTKSDEELYRELISDGILIIRKYIKNIEEIYHLSDCYIFPTVDLYNSVQMPLSVLEAMGCNIPVITTRFGGIPDYFFSGHGLLIVEDDEDIIVKFRRVLDESPKYKRKIKNNLRVARFYWDNIARRLEEIYTNLLGETS